MATGIRSHPVPLRRFCAPLQRECAGKAQPLTLALYHPGAEPAMRLNTKAARGTHRIKAVSA